MTAPLKVFICDDHTLFRSGVRASLESREFIEIIGEAENGMHLINQLDTLKPDMIIMGISMPVMDGLTALPILRSRFPHIKVIILSMHNDPAMICQALERGATTYLTKECGAEKIYETILACRNKWFHINDIVQKAIINKKEVVDKEKEHQGSIQLNEKEVAIMKLLSEWKSTNEIAEFVNLSPGTVELIINRLKEKTDTSSKAGLLRYCVVHKLIILE